MVLGLGATSIALGTQRDDPVDPSAAPAAADGVAPALAAFPGDDPLAAPDCDPATGRLMIPLVYAPNCVPVWDESRDNGGDTWDGVTADEIKIGVYVPQVVPTIRAAQEAAIGRPLPTEEEDAENRDQVMDALNALWETYGRTVTWTPIPASGLESDEVAAKADAIRAAEEIGVFAVVGGPTGTKAFAAELAARQVICICTDSQPVENLEQWAPYVWAPGLASTQRFDMVAELVASLDGQPAAHAGGDLVGQTRTFALVYADTADGAQRAGAEHLASLLDDAGVDLAATVPYVFDLASMQEQAGTMVSRMKESGVTSIVFAGEPWMPYYVGVAATAESWFPEWVLAGTGLTDMTASGRRYDQQQWRHAFGVSSLLARVSPAVAEQEGNFVEWHLGEELTSYPNLIELPTLFTGIQLAGPNLTPATFRDGLFSYLPVESKLTSTGLSWGLQDIWDEADYAGADDVTLVWWDADAVGPHEVQPEGETGQGMYRYVDGGRRYLPGELVGQQVSFFDPAGTVLVYDERPPAEVVPTYPRREGRDR
jgi:hypothetical protein